MCGRYALYAGPSRVRQVFELSETPRDLVPRYSIAPGQAVPVVRLGADGQRVGGLLRWGLMPRWPEGPRGGARMINARAENALMAPIHDRMPVIVEPGDFAPWLGLSVPGVDAVGRVATPLPPERMVVYPVGPEVNDPHRDGPELIRPA